MTKEEFCCCCRSGRVDIRLISGTFAALSGEMPRSQAPAAVQTAAQSVFELARPRSQGANRGSRNHRMPRIEASLPLDNEEEEVGAEDVPTLFSSLSSG